MASTKTNSKNSGIWRGFIRKPALFAFAFLYYVSMTSSAAPIELFGIEFFGGEEEEQTDQVVDPVIYEAKLEMLDSDDGELEQRLEQSSLLIQQQESVPTGASGLIGRAQIDLKRLVAILYQEGRYGGLVEIYLADQLLSTLNFGNANFSDEEFPVEVRIQVTPGEVFTFRNIWISEVREPKVSYSHEFYGLIQEESAQTSKILTAEQRIIDELNNQGYPFAKIVERSVIADHADKVVDVSLTVDRGDKSYFGEVQVEGNEHIDTDFILLVANIPVGSAYSTDAIKEAEKRLRSLNVFDRARVHLTPGEERHEIIPLTISVSESKWRFVGSNLSISSVDGLTASAYSGLRNLTGRAEQLRLELTGAGVGRSNLSDLDYGVDANFVIPAAIDENTDFLLSTGYNVENTKSFSSGTFNITTGLVHRFNAILTGTANLEYEHAQVEEDDEVNSFGLVGFPVDLNWDARDSKLDPNSGFTSRISVDPVFEGIRGHTIGIVKAGGTVYKAFDSKKQVVLASKVDLGSVIGTQVEDIPANRRFLLGGGDSVRGYGYRTIGYEDEGKLNAGRAMAVLSGEARFRVSDLFGIVPFVDFGAVYDSELPDLSEQIYVGTGLGLRYFTGIGPLRADFATPLNRIENSSAFAVYIGFGQVF